MPTLSAKKVAQNKVFILICLNYQEKGPEEQKLILKKILRRENIRRNKIKAAGIDFEYPDIVCIILYTQMNVIVCDTEIDECDFMLPLYTTQMNII